MSLSDEDRKLMELRRRSESFEVRGDEKGPQQGSGNLFVDLRESYSAALAASEAAATADRTVEPSDTPQKENPEQQLAQELDSMRKALAENTKLKHSDDARKTLNLWLDIAENPKNAKEQAYYLDATKRVIKAAADPYMNENAIVAMINAEYSRKDAADRGAVTTPAVEAMQKTLSDFSEENIRSEHMGSTRTSAEETGRNNAATRTASVADNAQEQANQVGQADQVGQNNNNPPTMSSSIYPTGASPTVQFAWQSRFSPEALAWAATEVNTEQRTGNDGKQHVDIVLPKNTKEITLCENGRIAIGCSNVGDRFRPNAVQLQVPEGAVVHFRTENIDNGTENNRIHLMHNGQDKFGKYNYKDNNNQFVLHSDAINDADGRYSGKDQVYFHGHYDPRDMEVSQDSGPESRGRIAKYEKNFGAVAEAQTKRVELMKQKESAEARIPRLCSEIRKYGRGQLSAGNAENADLARGAIRAIDRMKQDGLNIKEMKVVAAIAAKLKGAGAAFTDDFSSFNGDTVGAQPAGPAASAENSKDAPAAGRGSKGL